VGLDGVEAGLADRLQLLAGGARADDRHRSLRSALDWSYALLSEFGQALLRRTSVFASPFTVEAARAVAGDRPPPPVEDVRGGLARLVDQNLLATVADAGGTRYRMLETIRQYGTGMLVEARERDATATRHLAWCQEAGEALAATAGTDPVAWGAAFDRLADDMRSALTWAATRSGHLREAHRLAVVLANLTFARGMPGEAQRRYEQATTRWRCSARPPTPRCGQRIRRVRRVTSRRRPTSSTGSPASSGPSPRTGPPRRCSPRHGRWPAATRLRRPRCSQPRRR
jgi:predicted ATPase